MTGTGLGYADLHLHQFSEQAFGGRVFWGSAAAADADLASCRPMHGPHGLFDLTGALSRLVLGTGSATALLGHRTSGAPGFPGWPAWSDLTHQSVPRSGLRRAVDGGLRLIVMMATNNEIIGRLSGGTDVGDMAAVARQLRAAAAFEAAVDAEAGGPGRGWYRLVRSPAEARQAITAGRLAVVPGIEVDHLFGGAIDSGSTADDVAAEVARYHALGVRHILPIHLKDSVFGGAAFHLALHWSRSGGPLSRVNPPLTVPVFRMRTGPRPGGYDHRAGHCNRRGLSRLGRDLVTALMAHGMMIDVDHMSAASRADTLQLTGSAGYPVIAGHAEIAGVAAPGRRSERLLTDDEITAIGRHGGLVAPVLRQMSVAGPAGHAGTAEAFLVAYHHVRRLLPDSAVPFGSDLNGFAGLPRPAPGGATTGYPFPAPVTGRSLDRSALGARRFRLDEDGVAHVGMLPDFVADLVARGLDVRQRRPLLASAMGYVESWERAVAAR